MAYSGKVRLYLLLLSMLAPFIGIIFVLDREQLPFGGTAAPFVLLGGLLAALVSGVVLWRCQRMRRELVRPRDFRLRVAGVPEADRRTFIARGFEWRPEHIERLQAFTLGGLSLPRAVKDEIAGNWMIHGIGAAQEDGLFIPNGLLNQHLYILGAPGTGKTRFLELLVEQAIRRGESVIVIDPKGDERLLDRVWDSAVRHGRSADFRLFAPPYPSRSVRYNPVRCYAQPNDVGDRIALLLPRGGESEAFRKHAVNFANIVACALHTLREEISLAKLNAHLFHDPWGLAWRLIEHYGITVRETDRGEVDLPDFRAWCLREGKSYPDLDALLGMASMNRDHFTKLSSAIRPILGKLATRSLGYLLCPGDIEDPPEPGDHAQQDPLTWEDVDRGRKIVFLFLGSLMGEDTASAMAKLALADLASFLGRKYAFQNASRYAPMTVIVDEVADALDAPSVNILNKARGAGVSVVLAGQSVADLDVALGSHADARRALANIATFITLRAANPEDAKYFSDKCGLRPQRHVSDGESYEPALFSSGRRDIDDFAYRTTRSVTTKSEVLVPTWAIDELPRGHFFATWAGQVYKGMFPLLEDPEALYSPELKRSALLSHRTQEPPVRSERDGSPRGRVAA